MNGASDVASLLHAGAQQIREAGSDTPLLDSRVLLAHAIGVPVDSLYARYRDAISDRIARTYAELISRRSAGEPVAYICGHVEFYGRTFRVDRRVLVPRPETELLVEAAVRTARSLSPGKLLDACTGSGCVAITLKAELPEWDVAASDISVDALEVTRRNATDILGEELTCLHASGIPVHEGPFTIITANPPYVPTDLCPRTQGRASPSDSPAWEPRIALDGGPAGTEVVDLIARGAYAALIHGGWLLLEIGYDQGQRVTDLLAQIGFGSVSCEEDLAGLDRVVLGQKR